MKPIAKPLLSPVVAGLWRMAEWDMDVPDRVRWIEQALELGIDSFDSADIYGGGAVESLFGKALAAAPALRQRLRIVGKCGIRPPEVQGDVTVKHYDTCGDYVRGQVEATLRKLGVEQLHMVLIHRPDALMDADALAGTFATLTEAGKVAHWGVSNHAPSQFALLHDRHPLVTNQVELSPLHLDTLHDGTLDQAQQLRLRPMIWSPLGGGRLFHGDDQKAVRVRGAMEPIADRLGISLATLAYAWVLRHPSRPHPITGTSRVEGLREAVAALKVELGAEDWYAIWTASAGQSVP